MALVHGLETWIRSPYVHLLFFWVIYVATCTYSTLCTAWLMRPTEFPHALWLCGLQQILFIVVLGSAFFIVPTSFPWLLTATRAESERGSARNGSDTPNGAEERPTSGGVSVPFSVSILVIGILSCSRDLLQISQFQYADAGFTQILRQLTTVMTYVLLLLHDMEEFDFWKAISVLGAVFGALLTVSGAPSTTHTGLALVMILVRNLVACYTQIATQWLLKKKSPKTSSSTSSDTTSSENHGFTGTALGSRTVENPEPHRGDGAGSPASASETASLNSRGGLESNYDSTEPTAAASGTESVDMALTDTPPAAETETAAVKSTVPNTRPDALTFTLLIAPVSVALSFGFLALQHGVSGLYAAGAHFTTKIVAGSAPTDSASYLDLFMQPSPASDVFAAFRSTWMWILAHAGAWLMMSVLRNYIISINGALVCQLGALLKDVIVIAWSAAYWGEIVHLVQILGCAITTGFVAFYLYHDSSTKAATREKPVDLILLLITHIDLSPLVLLLLVIVKMLLGSYW